MLYSVVPPFAKTIQHDGITPSTLGGFVKITAFGFLQSKEEVMAVRLREADNIAAMAELQQQISELEIQVNIVFLTEICI